jgi:glycosyltransferase involved in cell wall biosynthesis
VLTQPLVSAIIPTYNREGTVVRAVKSALAQTYENLEVIVVDDGSSDSTLRVLQQFEGRIMVLRQQNAGPSKARNLGASSSRGEILAFLDSDDEWLPDKIEKQVRMMQGYGSSMPCCICNAAYTGGSEASERTSFNLAALHPPFESAVLVNPVTVLTSTFVLFNQVAAIRRDSFDEVGGFNEQLRVLEDYELSLRLATLGSWGLLRETLVLKNEDTVGIGVAVMRDEIKHLAAQEAVIESILSNPRLQSESVQAPMLAKLRRTRRQQSIHRWVRRTSVPMQQIGRALLFSCRLGSAVARRLPGQDRPIFRSA